MKKIALGSWAFAFGPYASDPIPFEKTAEKMASAGYDAIEICGIHEHVTLSAYPTKESRAELRSKLDDLGLERAGYGGDHSEHDPTEANKKEGYLEQFARVVELCSDIGVRDIRVDTVAPPDKYENDEQHLEAKRHVAEAFHDAAEKAQQAGMRMHWEFEPGFIFNKPSEIVELYNLVDHPNFYVMYDTSHAYMCSVIGARQYGKKETLTGGIEELLANLQGKVGSVHLIDSDGTLHNNETSTHNPFGTGYIDFRSIAPKLLEVPNIDYWTVDMCFWPGSWHLIESQLAYVRKLITEIERAA